MCFLFPASIGLNGSVQLGHATPVSALGAFERFRGNAYADMFVVSPMPDVGFVSVRPEKVEAGMVMRIQGHGAPPQLPLP